LSLYAPKKNIFIFTSFGSFKQDYPKYSIQS
jgi:hypothetical protein